MRPVMRSFMPGRARAAGVAVLVAALLLVAGPWGVRRAERGEQPVLGFSLSLPSWPWWGPRVRVGDKELRPGIRVRPGTPVRLVLWDVEQPTLKRSGGWAQVLEQGVAAFRRRYPGVEVEIRVLGWNEWDEAMTKAAQGGPLPDVLGTPDATFHFDPARHVPLELYWQQYWRRQLKRSPEEAVLPGALRLASSQGHLWGIPRWMEWMGWIRRTDRDVGGISTDIGSPLTWRYLALTLPGRQAGSTPLATRAGEKAVAPPAAVWQEARLQAAARWLQEAAGGRNATQDGLPRRRGDRSLLEALFDGTAGTAGPVSGRLLYRLGWWPQGGSGQGGTFTPAPGEDDGGKEGRIRLPGPLLAASSYAVLAGPQSDSPRVQLAFELAVHLARWTSQAIAGHEGVVPVWRAGGDPEQVARQAPPERAGGDEQPPPPPWWASTAFPPGTRTILTTPSPVERKGQQAMGQVEPPGMGAQEWTDRMQELQVVAERVRKLAAGEESLVEFIERTRVVPVPPQALPARPAPGGGRAPDRGR
ncbi:hypothetical protein U7230_11335 [Carboxydochorda subterranea]|uniref:Extracellular solute-binding protein n=1 Tax=Carboxydichorda subterranea TaxID=3109565 RepID=A0ABZ1BVH0_9FIRM|nr:hypothetical protein [Limnochorda sp. L945t]WRP16679.1 hypothetical protein U7230_11335 [Limnochorda sp. L945t]